MSATIEEYERECLQQQIEVMQAFLNGKQIQSYVRRGTIVLRIDELPWQNDLCPTWNWEMCDYRVKPQGD